MSVLNFHATAAIGDLVPSSPPQIEVLRACPEPPAEHDANASPWTFGDEDRVRSAVSVDFSLAAHADALGDPV
jgi:hypothetical protein